MHHSNWSFCKHGNQSRLCGECYDGSPFFFLPISQVSTREEMKDALTKALDDIAKHVSIYSSTKEKMSREVEDIILAGYLPQQNLPLFSNALWCPWEEQAALRLRGMGFNDKAITNNFPTRTKRATQKKLNHLKIIGSKVCAKRKCSKTAVPPRKKQKGARNAMPMNDVTTSNAPALLSNEQTFNASTTPASKAIDCSQPADMQEDVVLSSPEEDRKPPARALIDSSLAANMQEDILLSPPKDNRKLPARESTDSLDLYNCNQALENAGSDYLPDDLSPQSLKLPSPIKPSSQLEHSTQLDPSSAMQPSSPLSSIEHSSPMRSASPIECWAPALIRSSSPIECWTPAPIRSLSPIECWTPEQSAMLQPNAKRKTTVCKQWTLPSDEIMNKLYSLLDDPSVTHAEETHKWHGLLEKFPSTEDKIFTVLNEEFKGESLHRIHNNRWLDDISMNTYWKLLQLREENFRRKLGSQHKKCVFLPTHFYSYLCRNGIQSGDKWIKENIFDCDYVFIPVHEGMHWVTVCVDIKGGNVVCYDPLSRMNSSHSDTIISLLQRQEELREVKRKKKWRTSHPSHGIPRQSDAVSCGVVALIYANFLSAGKPLESMSTPYGCPHYRAHIGALLQTLYSSLVTR